MAAETIVWIPLLLLEALRDPPLEALLSGRGGGGELDSDAAEPSPPLAASSEQYGDRWEEGRPEAGLVSNRQSAASEISWDASQASSSGEHEGLAIAWDEA